MNSISKEAITELRAKTGVSVMAVKKALEAAGGNMSEAEALLKKEAMVVASKKEGREATAGIVQSYVHAGRIGALVKINCETDFVARNPDFQNFAREMAMQVAASEATTIEEFLREAYIRDGSLSVSNYIKEVIAKFGEKIEIAAFEKLAL